MVTYLASAAAALTGAHGFSDSAAWPRLIPAHLLVGRGIVPVLPGLGLPPLGGYALYLEEILAVLLIILVPTSVQGQSKQPVRLGAVKTVMAALFKWWAQPIQALAGQVAERGSWRHKRQAYHLSRLPADTFPRPTIDPHATLNELLRAAEASDGFIAVRQGNCFAVVASVNALPVGHRLDLADSAAVADYLRMTRFDECVEPSRHVNELAGKLEAYPDREFERMVEQALKRLSDYSVLGRSRLVSRLQLEPASQIQQAKWLRGMLVDAIESLRPASAEPNGLLPREWQAYTILRDAYINDVPNRDIMSKLYISEGTFNRQRRKALHAVATAIWEVRQLDTAAVMDEADQGSR